MPTIGSLISHCHVKWLMNAKCVLKWSNKQLLLIPAELHVDYMHWGEIVKGVVDQRGEEALLTRNIVIHSEMADK